jgi:hypothetical protein
MGYINFQFHATKKEITEYLKECTKMYELFMVCIQLFPMYTCEVLNKNELEYNSMVIDNSQVICLFHYKPITSPKKYIDFIKMNSESLIFTIGQQDDNFIKETLITANAKNDVIMKNWKRILSDFKKNMLKGAWVVNPQNGAKEYYKNHRYTYLAKKAFEDGIEIKAFAGWCIYLLCEED